MSHRIQTTIGALVEAEPALNKLAGMKLPAKTRYHVVKLAQLVRAELKWHFYDPRHEAFQEFGDKRDPTAAERTQFGPDPVLEVPPSKLAPFRARIRELTEVSVEIPWGPITAEMLEPCDDCTGADMLALGPLCELGGDEEGPRVPLADETRERTGGSVGG